MKKRKQIINSRFKKGDKVKVKYRDEYVIGWVKDVIVEGSNLYFNIELGGECPIVLYRLKENELIKTI